MASSLLPRIDYVDNDRVNPASYGRFTKEPLRFSEINPWTIAQSKIMFFSLESVVLRFRFKIRFHLFTDLSLILF